MKQIKVLADASLQGVVDFFPSPFELSFYTSMKDLFQHLENAEILLCRSTLKVNQELLQTHQPRFIATASSGTDHIDKEFLKKMNISLLDAKGSNAHSVADYVLSCIAYTQKYLGLKGRCVGIIGCGAVGSEVARRLQRFHFEVCCYDPFRSLEDQNFHSVPLEKLLQSDIICIHANLHDNQPFPSRHLLAEAELKSLKPDTVLINAARGDIVNEEALLALRPPIVYCADVYSEEPNISSDLIAYATIATPHIAGHSIEAKSNALRMLSQQLHAHYDLKFPIPTPTSTSKSKSLTKEDKKDNWQDLILNHYNPIIETRLLKEAEDKKEAFLRLRRDHQYRRDLEG